MSFENPITQPTLEFDGATLRPVRKSDAGLLALYAGDARVAKMTSSIPHPLAPGTTEGYVARAQSVDRTEDVWIIDGSETSGSEVLGVVSLRRMDRNQSEIGYWIAPPMWNTGLASHAVETLVAANPQACRTIFGAVFQDNPASARVLTNAGFDYIGDAEVFSIARDAIVRTWTYIKQLG